jgi:hypothetical protein
MLMLQRNRWGVEVFAHSGLDSFNEGSKGANAMPASNIPDWSQSEVFPSSASPAGAPHRAVHKTRIVCRLYCATLTIPSGGQRADRGALRPRQAEGVAMKRTLLAYLAIGALLSAPCAFAQQTGHDASLVAKFQAALRQDGFSIQPGVVSDTDWAGLYCNGERANAGYVNKAPYLLIQVPKSADDPSPVENFKLRPDEAIVLIGPTPPPTKYFGYYAFLATMPSTTPLSRPWNRHPSTSPWSSS